MAIVFTYHIGTHLLTWRCASRPPRPPRRAHGVHALQRRWGAALPPPCSLLSSREPAMRAGRIRTRKWEVYIPINLTDIYAYTSDLLCLDFCSGTGNTEFHRLRRVATPLDVATSGRSIRLLHLSRPPIRVSDWLQRYASSQIGPSEHGISPRAPRSGVRVPRERTGAGSDAGPIPASVAAVHINRFGVIPKGHNTGRWRLITDLLFPRGHSVNGGIVPDLCSLTYSTIDEIADLMARLGPAALLAKVDIESAYRLIPVHPDDRPLLAMEWENQLYIDPMLPFGLRSAPKIFNAVADALACYLHQKGIPLIRRRFHNRGTSVLGRVPIITGYT